MRLHTGGSKLLENNKNYTQTTVTILNQCDPLSSRCTLYLFS